MTKKSRTILFFLLLLVFVFITPGIILYSQGYRFDIKRLALVETGGIYIKTNPTDVNVYINDIYENRTSGFSKDLLIQNLIPGTHKIRLEKDDFYPWEKNLVVKEKMVSEIKYIILFSKNNIFNKIDSDIKNFYPSPSENKFILLTLSNELISYDNENKELKKLLTSKESPYKISDIIFSPSGKKIVIETESGLHYLLNLEIKFPAPVLIKKFSSKTENIYFDHNNENIFYYQNNNKIYKLNIEKENDPQLIKDNIETFTLNNDNLYFMENGEIIRNNVLLGTSEKITNNKFIIKDKSTYNLTILENELFVFENKKIVYRLDKETKSFIKIIEDETEIKYTPFYERIIFASDNNIWLLLLKNTDTPFFEKAYSLIHISEFSSKIGDIKWLNGDYFVYTSNNKLSISEIDNRDKINVLELAPQNTSKIFFNGNSKKLFVLDQNNFMVSENKVIP